MKEDVKGSAPGLVEVIEHTVFDRVAMHRLLFCSIIRINIFASYRSHLYRVHTSRLVLPSLTISGFE